MKRRSFFNIAIAAVIVTQLSCQFITGAFSGGGGSGYYTQPGNPIDVTLTLDNTNVTAVVSAVDGGELSVAGSDGSRYTLTIPPEALVMDTEVSMTPIASIDGLPFSGGFGGAVKLEPSGLTFFDFLTLTIEPAIPIPPENQILFGFEEDGEDLHLAIPGNDPSQIQIRLLSFSGAGVGNGISAEMAGVMQRSADRAEVRISSQVAEYLQIQRQKSILGIEADDEGLSGVEGQLNEYVDSVVIPRLKAAASESASCADARKALQTYLSFERQRQLLGTSPEGGDKISQLAAELMPIAAKKCLKEEFDRCANKHMIAGMLPALLQFERTGQLLGQLDPSNPAMENKAWAEVRTYGEELVQKCFQWDLEFESAGSFDAGDGMSYDSRVKSKIHLKTELPLLSLVIHGSSALINEDFTFRLTDCEATPSRGGGEFVAHSLSWVTDTRKKPDGEREFFIKDFSLKYFPGNTSESAFVHCPAKYDWDEPTDFPVPSGPWWTSIFIATHIQESDGGENQSMDPRSMLEGGIPMSAQEMAFNAQSWIVYEAELMATKEWEGGSDLDSGVFEGGEFRLVHKPQK